MPIQKPMVGTGSEMDGETPITSNKAPTSNEQHHRPIPLSNTNPRFLTRRVAVSEKNVAAPNARPAQIPTTGIFPRKDSGTPSLSNSPHIQNEQNQKKVAIKAV
ncbi:MAG TPA: hypothetical protein VFD58_29335 [Blastocatellia bacterium]|nr:hypothetical protein [Blastocatellia bacterium]